ncbi:MAG: TetR/AcrR family transcriptional regulator [candidate division Zixibacteria bacterium]|nr:TetR/AcrR family transcriptional regulator [candidate division Zixibacteria bacterium]
MGDRKGQILQEATTLFSQYGYDKVTIKQLANACGITEPALYRHFSSKDAIYGAVLDSLKKFLKHEEIFKELRNESELEAILKGLASHILRFFNSNRELYRLLLYSTLREHRKARQVFRDVRGPYVDFLISQLNRLHDEGKIIDKNNEITARCFVGMVFDCAMGASLWKGYQGKIYKPEEVISNNVPIFIKGLTT